MHARRFSSVKHRTQGLNRGKLAISSCRSSTKKGIIAFLMINRQEYLFVLSLEFFSCVHLE